MITAIELAKFAEKNGWIVIEQDKDCIRFLTPSGQKVLIEFTVDGSIFRVYP